MKPDLKPKVLVIDDDDSVRKSFCLYLEDHDYLISEASNGREGLACFEKDSPDIVLIDLRMPEVDGHQVLEKISSDSPDVPLIVISGTGYIGDVVDALRLGAWDYLLKPVTDLTILEHSISKALERARLLRENREYQLHLEDQVQQRTGELTKKVEEMTRFNRMAVGRERRIIELKRQINALNQELGREPKYRSPDMIEENTSLPD
jgi:DNA-binding NtrC family response regulator